MFGYEIYAAASSIVCAAGFIIIRQAFIRGDPLASIA